ncbi:MAG: metallophosphoesterase family protein [Actinomycetota bacterium]
MRRSSYLLAVLVVVAACAGDDAGPSPYLQTPTGSPTSTTAVPTPTLPTPTPTGPPPALMRFAVLGDFGAGTSDQYDLARRMCRWRRHHPFKRVFTTGDNVYDFGHPSQFQTKFFDPYACLLDRGVRFHASLGNHDYLTDRGRPEIREPAFGMKGRRYVIRLGGVRFVIADSNEMDRAWLRRETRAEPGDLWTIVIFHHPVYSTGEHGSTPGYAPDLPRLFRRRGVDLVLNGHDHLLHVSRSLRRIRYVVTGGGGARLYLCHEDRWFTATCMSQHHFMYFVVRESRIEARAVPKTGAPIYRFSTSGR